MKEALAAAICFLFTHHPEDVKRVFSDAELTEVLATTQPLQERSVEDVLHQAWKVAANTL